MQHFLKWWPHDWIQCWALIFIMSMTAFVTSEPMLVISVPIAFSTWWRFGDYIDLLFPLSDSEVKVVVGKIRWPSWLFNIINQNVSSPWNRSRRSDMLSSNPVVYVWVYLPGLWGKLYHSYQNLSKFCSLRFLTWLFF